MKKIALVIFIWIGSMPVNAAPLVSKETIDAFKKATFTFRLKNDIPVVFRVVPNSDILEIHVTSATGHRDVEAAKKPVYDLTFALIPRATASYNKEVIFETSEKYSYRLGCAPGFEFSTCSLGTINDYWEDGIKLLASMITEPKFNQDDIELYRERLISATKGALSDPEGENNELMDQIYYPVGHPYRNTLHERLKIYPTLTKSDLQAAHKQFLNAQRLSITVVGSIPEKALMNRLNELFGSISGEKYQRPAVNTIPYKDGDNTFTYGDRAIPTAYISIQFNAPNAQNPMSDSYRLLTRILSEQLKDEVRIKRSLSYAISASYSPLEIGVGEISASTSKPKETLDVVLDVLESLRNKEFTRSELEEQKNVYATAFFLSQEEHSSLANSLISNMYWRKNANTAYEFPQRLSLVTPHDIRAVAQEYFTNFKISVVYAKGKFEQSWAEKFNKYFSSASIKKRSKSRKKDTSN